MEMLAQADQERLAVYPKYTLPKEKSKTMPKWMLLIHSTAFIQQLYNPKTNPVFYACLQKQIRSRLYE